MGIEAVTIDKYEHLAKYAQPIQVPNRKMVGREKEMREIKAAMHRPELCNVLLLGEAGSGKACDNNTFVPVADDRGYVPIGEIKVGDFVFDETGQPTEVLGVFPQGLKDAYEVDFKDGTSIVCNDEHLWSVRNRKGHYSDSRYSPRTLRDLIDSDLVRVQQSGARKGMRVYKWYVPCNKPVVRPERIYSIDPYVMGVMLGDGCLRSQQFSISSNDQFVVEKVSDLINAVGYEKSSYNYTWCFIRSNATPSRKFIQTYEMADLLPGVENLFGCTSLEKRIPRDYFLGSIDQRYALLHGLMDTDGTVTGNDRINCLFSTNNLGLAEDVRELAASLGMRTTLSCQMRNDDLHVNPEYEVYFIIADSDKHTLFTLPRHLEKLEAYRRTDKKFNKHYDDICITDVKDLHKQVPMTCLYVAAESHLFQIGKAHIVTHNTMLVQSTMMNDQGKLYLEVDLAKMVADCETDVNQMASKLKSLFDDAMKYVNEEKQELVLFMDEFHQVVQLSDAAVEALKPLLADSGVRGIRVITATTPVEFRRHISPNQPLVERLQRINLAQTDKETTISILKGMAERYGVADQIYNDAIYESIYEYTNRYIPANAQPRKSILIMDAMIGWHRSEGRKIDKYLLADVIYESEGVNVAFKVDASKIKARLDKKVLSQKFATQVIEQRLQLCVADLNNKGRPMSSFLFSGSSGSGKTEMVKSLAEILFDDDRSLLRFDCTEYANAESLERFRRELTARAWEHPHSIILLDEIEKACSPVTRLLLQVLDDGRLIDENNREVSFTNAYIVMTTNAGSEIYRTIAQYAADDDGSGKSMSRYDKLIRNSISTTTGDNRFPPELLGRIDCIVPFQPLSEQTMKDIARMKLQKLRREILQRHGIKVVVQEKVIRYLVEDNLDTDSDSGGARTVVSKLESEVTTKIAKFINENPGIYKIKVSVEGTLAADDVNKLLSDAYIQVSAAL